MDYFQTFILGLGLALDGIALYLLIGVSSPGLRLRAMMGISAIFAIFQIVMPTIGYLIAEIFDDRIARAIPWISAGLLLFLGGRMLIGALRCREEKGKESASKLSFGFLLIQATATSLDSLAVGVLFVSGSPESALLSFLEIGLITLSVAMCGILLGRRFGLVMKRKAELAGGIMLVGLGGKMFLEQLLPVIRSLAL